MSVNSTLKATEILGQRKAFYRQKIPESSYARKETVDIDILATSRNDDRKIIQSIRIISRPPRKKQKWNQLNQFWRTSTKVILTSLKNLTDNNGTITLLTKGVNEIENLWVKQNYVISNKAIIINCSIIIWTFIF